MSRYVLDDLDSSLSLVRCAASWEEPVRLLSEHNCESKLKPLSFPQIVSRYGTVLVNLVAEPPISLLFEIKACQGTGFLWGVDSCHWILCRANNLEARRREKLVLVNYRFWMFDRRVSVGPSADGWISLESGNRVSHVS